MNGKPSYEELERQIEGLEKQTAEGMIIKNDLHVRLEFEQLISDLSAIFINLPPGKVDTEINKGLRRMVEFLGFDRGSLFQFKDNHSSFKLTHSWAAEGHTPQEPYLPKEKLPWVFNRIVREKKALVLSKLDDLPKKATLDRAFFKKFGPSATISVPLIVGGKVVGAVAFGLLQRECEFSSDMVNRIQTVGDIFANALMRKQADISLNHALSEVRRLKEQLQAECTQLRNEIKLEHNFEEIIGESNELKYALYKIEQVAATDATVLIQGETGTGKELVARAIHNYSLRKKRPLVKVDCGTLPANLIESELFGYEKGAFTGALLTFTGRFEIADKATIFLDEIGELPIDLQMKLLRVIQEGTFERLGSTKTRKVDVRIIAATNRVLEDEIKKGRFREDLYFRLNVFPITLPPLRQRSSDIPLLVNAFVNKFNRKMGKQIGQISNHTYKSLEKYNWPGNVRELENMVERAVIVSSGISLEMEPPEQLRSLPIGKHSLEQVERAHILRVLEAAHWKITGRDGAAEILQMNSSTLRSRMKKLGIKRP